MTTLLLALGALFWIGATAVARIHKLRAGLSLKGIKIKDLVAEGRK